MTSKCRKTMIDLANFPLLWIWHDGYIGITKGTFDRNASAWNWASQ